MKKIALTRGKNVFVDDSEFDFLSQWSWYAAKIKASTYARRSKDSAYMHRLIMGVSSRNTLVDHVDNNGLNNQKANLRVCTHSQNRCNMVSRRDNKSGQKGVFWRKDREKFTAYIDKNKKRYHLGCFRTFEEAAEAYRQAAIKYHGDFAKW